jgi:hypothetical protein
MNLMNLSIRTNLKALTNRTVRTNPRRHSPRANSEPVWYYGPHKSDHSNKSGTTHESYCSNDSYESYKSTKTFSYIDTMKLTNLTIRTNLKAFTNRTVHTIRTNLRRHSLTANYEAIWYYEPDHSNDSESIYELNDSYESYKSYESTKMFTYIDTMNLTNLCPFERFWKHLRIVRIYEDIHLHWYYEPHKSVHSNESESIDESNGSYESTKTFT